MGQEAQKPKFRLTVRANIPSLTAPVLMLNPAMKWVPSCRNAGMGKMVIRGLLGYAHWPQLGSQTYCPIRNQFFWPIKGNIHFP